MPRSYIVSLVSTVVITAVAVVGAAIAGWTPLLGLDLQGGIAVTYEPTEATDEESLDQAVEIIRQRVDALGVAEPDITRQGQTIVVELPGVDDAERALELVGQTAELRFRPVLFGPLDATDAQARLIMESALVTAQGLNIDTGGGAPADDGTTATTVAPTTTETTASDEGADEAGAEPPVVDVDEAAPAIEAPPDDSTTTVASPETTGSTTTAATTTTTDDAGENTETTTTGDDTTTSTPETTTPETTTTTEFDESSAPSLDEVITPPEADIAEDVVLLPSSDGRQLFLLGPTEATGTIVSGANATFTQEWSVTANFTSEGGDIFNEVAQRNFGQQLGIVLDGKVESAPTINATDFAGSAIISGTFTQDDAEDLALVLRFGALPVELEAQTVQQVSATLGDDALRAGLTAGIIGLLLVAAFMIAYYRLLGVVAILSLMVSTAILWFLISWLGETRGLALSLSGTVGIILSIGVAVDSNIVYYERIKEEVRRGRAVRSAADGSFAGAFSTIVKADFASLIGAVILFSLTVGAVKGFALFLGVATVIDMLVSYVFMRPMVVLVARKFAAKNPERLGITHIPGSDAEVPA